METPKKFVDQLKRKELEVVRRHNFTVHAELAMLMAMAREEIPHAIPYIGISKLSYILCRHLQRGYGAKYRHQRLTREGLPGWSWPIPPARDGEVREGFLKGIRQQLYDDFVELADNDRRKSDSSAGSDAPSN